LAGCLTVAGATTASAWSWSSTVTLKGTNGCGGIQSAKVVGEFNTQRQTWTGSNDQTYRLTFTNVPAGGGWAWLYSYCGVTANHGTWARVYRPAVGSEITVNLGQAY
jgi:hypothetical protein